MKIPCVNWQNPDEAELEREHHPDVEFVIARSTNGAAAMLDPADCETADAVINCSPTHSAPLPPAMVDLRLKSVGVVHAYLKEGRLTDCVNGEYLKP